MPGVQQQPFDLPVLPTQGIPLDAWRPLDQVAKGMPVLVPPPAAPPARDMPTLGPRVTPDRKVANRICPVCEGAVHAKADGAWRCGYCGSKGGTRPGEGMYVRERGTAAAGAAPPKLGRAQRRRQERHTRKRKGRK